MTDKPRIGSQRPSVPSGGNLSDVSAGNVARMKLRRRRLDALISKCKTRATAHGQCKEPRRYFRRRGRRGSPRGSARLKFTEIRGTLQSLRFARRVPLIDRAANRPYNYVDVMPPQLAAEALTEPMAGIAIRDAYR
jgi:hypothetical protein